MMIKYETIKTADLANVTGGRHIVNYVYQSGLGMVPVYNTDMAAARGVVDGYMDIFGGIR